MNTTHEDSFGSHAKLRRYKHPKPSPDPSPNPSLGYFRIFIIDIIEAHASLGERPLRPPQGPNPDPKPNPNPNSAANPKPILNPNPNSHRNPKPHPHPRPNRNPNPRSSDIMTPPGRISLSFFHDFIPLHPVDSHSDSACFSTVTFCFIAFC